MKNEFSYPSNYEIEQVLTQFCSNSFVNSFSQSKGIFLIRSSKEEIATDLSKFYFDSSDLDKIKDEAYRRNVNHTLSGFILKVQDAHFDPITAVQNIRVFYGNNNPIRFEPITQETQESETWHMGKVNLKDYKPGRLQFLQGEDRTFDYTIQKISTDQYQIFVDGSKSSDSKLLEEILKKQIGKDGEIDLINIDKLTTNQAILFFDELANRFGKGDWAFQEVKHLVIKKFKNDEEEKEADKEELTGITQAIIEGHNLRDNAFVKNSENDGYTFTAMKYEFSHRTSPYVVQINAEFKSRPKVFEISIANFKKREGIMGTLHEITIEKSIEFKINTDFWKIAKTIYNELTYGSRTLVKTE